MRLQSNTWVVVATGARLETSSVRSRHLQEQAQSFPSRSNREGLRGEMPRERPGSGSDEVAFTKQIAQRIYNMAQSHEFDRLVLIADPGTLSRIRLQVHREVANRVVLEFDRTVLNSSISDIENAIEKAMSA